MTKGVDFLKFLVWLGVILILFLAVPKWLIHSEMLGVIFGVFLFGFARITARKFNISWPEDW